ncbi:MAG: hypothetical protein J7J32_00560 [Candidatus Atribacteria bacterium]|nr:hypothetical protein [Candidatus Atribacteria bacterium]MCD6349851.1 hypothetical protein [Candidatus Atribacteria bacterium]
MPNLPVYIQASGRTSRLSAGGITYGVSFVLEKNHLLEAFLQRAIYWELNFQRIPAQELEKIDFQSIEENLAKSRERYSSSKK